MNILLEFYKIKNCPASPAVSDVDSVCDVKIVVILFAVKIFQSLRTVCQSR